MVAQGADVVVVGRRSSEELDALKGVQVITGVDVTDTEAMATKMVPAIDKPLDMVINSAGYLILPKVLASVFIFPVLVVISMFLGICAGALIGEFAGVVSFADFEQGIQYDFRPFQIAYAVIKTTVFAFIITSVSAYCGYHVRGGALEVGRASTQAVVWSIVLIMTFNVILTQVLLL